MKIIMSKRRLNKQQLERIASNHATVSQSADDIDLLHGLVITHYGKEVEVLRLNADKTIANQTTTRCHFRAKLPTIVCGDVILWRAPPANSGTGVIEALLERESLLKRPRPYQDPKPVAANIDTIFITLSPQPAPIISLIDRFLIAAENANINACILLNKQDLMGQNQAVTDEINEALALYTELGYPVYRYSAVDNGLNDDIDGTMTDSEKDNIAQLRSAKFSDAENNETQRFIDALANKTSILVGQSGVGKSSIINTLKGNHRAKIGDISASNDKGKHTTTTSQMYQLAGADARIATGIIDSPGIREFGLWHLSPDDIINGLPEFQAHTENCKFRDCQHLQSKGCALQVAFDQGEIHPSRISSYHHILASLDQL